MTIIDNLKEVEKLRSFQSRTNKRINEITRPKLTDYAMIPLIWKWTLDLSEMTNKKKSDQRKVFILIVLSLFAPTVLIGDKMPQNLRRNIAETLGCEQSGVSHICRDLLFLFNHYGNFRQHVEKSYEGILERLEYEHII